MLRLLLAILADWISEKFPWILKGRAHYADAIPEQELHRPELSREVRKAIYREAIRTFDDRLQMYHLWRLNDFYNRRPRPWRPAHCSKSKTNRWTRRQVLFARKTRMLADAVQSGKST